MRIIGIDPGLCVSGYACIEAGDNGNKLIEAGTFRTSEKDPIEKRLDQIATDVAAILEKLKPDRVAVEQLYSHYAHPRTSILMGHARGVILQQCRRKAIEVKSFAATRVKKSVTGNGRASKSQIQRTIQHILGLPDPPEPNDVADAIAVAICCANDLNIFI